MLTKTFSRPSTGLLGKGWHTCAYHLGSWNSGAGAGREQREKERENESDACTTWHFKNPSTAWYLPFFSYLVVFSSNKPSGFRCFYGLLNSFSSHFYKPWTLSHLCPPNITPSSDEGQNIFHFLLIYLYRAGGQRWLSVVTLLSKAIKSSQNLQGWHHTLLFQWSSSYFFIV